MELTKQNKKTWLVSMSLALVCGLIGIASVASAQPPGGAWFRRGRLQRGGGPRGPDALMIPLGRLDLDDAQREQVRNVMRENRESRRTLGRAVREADGALEEAVAADVLDEQGIRAAATALGVAQGDAAVQRARVRNQVWQLLTAEQQARAREIQAERARRMAERRERMRERRERRADRDPA